MVDCQKPLFTATVLALKVVASEDVFSAEHELFIGDPDEKSKTYDGGQGIGFLYRADYLVRMLGNGHCLSAEKQNDRFLRVTYTQWFIAAVEYENF